MNTIKVLQLSFIERDETLSLLSSLALISPQELQTVESKKDSRLDLMLGSGPEGQVSWHSVHLLKNNM